MPLFTAVIRGRDRAASAHGDAMVFVRKADTEERAQGHNIFVATFFHERIKEALMLRIPGFAPVGGVTDIAVLANHPPILGINEIDAVVDDVWYGQTGFF